MSLMLPDRLLQKKSARTIATIYGIIMVNIGAILLYEKFNQAEVVIDKGFGMGAVSVGIGLVVLWFVYRNKDYS